MKNRICIFRIILGIILFGLGFLIGNKIAQNKSAIFTQRIGVDGYWVNGQLVEQCRSFNVLFK